MTLTPPLLCIEIVSPEDRLPRVCKRLDDFVVMGVPNRWIIDPMERTAYTYTVAGLVGVPGERSAIAGAPIYVDLLSLFQSLA